MTDDPWADLPVPASAGGVVPVRSPEPGKLFNVAAELGLLVEMLADNRVVDTVADICRPVDFSDKLLGRIFNTVVTECSAGRKIDGLTIEPFFRSDQDWADRRLAAGFASAAGRAIGRGQAKGYADHLVELARRRRLALGLEEVIAGARDLAVDHGALLTQSDEALAEIADVGQAQEQASAGLHATRVIETFGRPLRGVRCGIIGSLDRVMGPLMPGSLNLLAGRPGMMKTATASSLALGAADLGFGVLFVSLEMKGDELARRMLSDLCYDQREGVPYSAIRDGDVSQAQLREVLASRDVLDRLPLQIADRPGMTLANLRRMVRRDKRRRAASGGKLDLLIVDYLTLIKPAKAGMSLYEHATETSRGLKQLAMDEGLAILALAQLNRQVEARQERRPIPSDLRDSGQLEQDADLIVFLYRHEVYLAGEEPDNRGSADYSDWLADMAHFKNRIEFIVPKRRNGATGKADGFAYGEFQAVRGDDFEPPRER